MQQKKAGAKFAHSRPHLIGWQLRQHVMSEKKRTTVTTIETHEVWIIRRPVPELPDERVAITTLEKSQQDAAVLPSTEPTNGSETSTE